jgi:hypothetical protein
MSSFFKKTCFWKGRFAIVFFWAVLLASLSGLSQAQTIPGNQLPQPQISGPWVGISSDPVVSPAVRDMPDRVGAPPGKERPPRRNPHPELTGVSSSPALADDPVRQKAARLISLTLPPLVSVEGIGNLAGVTPPDPVGAVGPNHYVQMVNATFFSIYDKKGNLLKGPTPFNSLWSAAGGLCAADTDGDPVVVFDALAGRWVLAQLRFTAPFGLCVAVSQNTDPAGSYHLYEFIFPDNPDYFKLGVWPDAYYVGANETTYTAYALERDKMLLGQPAQFIRFTGETNFLMPATVDGNILPPANTPGHFYTFKNKDFPAHGVTTNRLELRFFHADWVNTANSTFSPPLILPIADFKYTVCGFFTTNCIPQRPPGLLVDAVSEWPMWRLPYRRFTSHEALVGNFTVDAGVGQAGIRWFELRRTTGDWLLYQEGTFAPDSLHRWMGSIAMDGSGNIALGYSVSSPANFPEPRYTTRRESDPPGVLGNEAVLVSGGGVQTGSNRWGDYSALTVDPVDQATFWYTGEYYSGTSPSQWNTRIGAFRVSEVVSTLFFPIVLKQ